jgi:ribonuclease BN (tRNA processing enzyme)
MRVEVLGVRVGAPLGAPCPSYAVGGSQGMLLLDCGPGALDALWRTELIHRLDAVVISHMHLDHMLDLLPYSGVVTREAVGVRFGEQERVPLFLPRGRGREVLGGLLEALGSDFGRLDETFVVEEYDDGDEVRVAGFELTFVPTAHPERCYAPRVSDGEATLFYSADSAYTPALVEHAAGADLALVEATYVDAGPQLMEQGHMTGEQAAALAHEAGARRLVLTHVMPFPEESGENLKRARARFDGPVELAEPGLVFTA